MVRIRARYFKHAILQHYNSKRSKCDTRSNLDLIHVVNAEVACLFHPIFDEWIAQSVFSFRLGKIRAFDDEAIFAHVFGMLSKSLFLDKSALAGVPTC